MVDVLTYKATKVYTPQTNEWAERAVLAQGIGRGLSEALKSGGKLVEGAEKRDLAQKKQTAKDNAEIVQENKKQAEAQARENKRQMEALAKEKKSAYDKMMDAQADDLAQRFQIELARQTRVINQQFELDPLNPEKENQTRAVAKDLQAQWLEKIPQASRERFIEKTNSKTNEYILSDVKSTIQKQISDSDNMMADNIKFAVRDTQQYAGMGDFEAVAKNFWQARADLANYVSGMMTPEEQDIALRQFDQSNMIAIIKGIAEKNPQLAKELKDNPAALAEILGGGDYVGELATRAELNKGMEEIAGMEFPKNTRYQREKEQAKLVNSLGVVELEYDNGGEKGLTLASSNANPNLTRYTAELVGGGVGKDLDVAIKQAENVQKAQLDKARYEGAVQSIFTASYQNLDQIKDSDLYKKGDAYTVGLANRYEQMLNDRRDSLDKAVEMTDNDILVAVKDFTKALDKIDGSSIDPVMDAYTQMAKIQAALSVKDTSFFDGIIKFLGITPGLGGAAKIGEALSPAALSDSLSQAFKDAVASKDFRADITQTIKNNWTPPAMSRAPWLAGESTTSSSTWNTFQQEVATREAESKAIAGFLVLAGQGRLDDAAKFYYDQRNAFYDSIYANWIDMNSVYKAWAEGKPAKVAIGNELFSAVERDADGQILFEDLMTKVVY